MFAKLTKNNLSILIIDQQYDTKWHINFHSRKMGKSVMLDCNFKSDDESNLARLQQIFMAQLCCFSCEVKNLLILRSEVMPDNQIVLSWK